MAITACREVWRGETFSDSKDGSRSYLMIYELLSDDILEAPVTLRAHPDLPSPLDTYPDDPAAICVDRQFRRDDKSRYLWFSECQFEWSPEQEKDEEDVNPLDREPKIRWTSALFNKPIVKDRNGDALVNSAGTYFDPPVEVDFVRWTANIQFNATSLPTGIRSYAGAVNESPITIDGELISAERARVIGLDISELQYWQASDDVSVPYRTITVALECRDDEDDDFELSLLDQGLMRKGDNNKPEHIEILDAESGGYSKVSAPVLLDGSGQLLDTPSDPTTAVFLDFDNPAIRLKDMTIFPGITS